MIDNEHLAIRHTDRKVGTAREVESRPRTGELQKDERADPSNYDL